MLICMISKSCEVCKHMIGMTIYHNLFAYWSSMQESLLYGPTETVLC